MQISILITKIEPPCQFHFFVQANRSAQVSHERTRRTLENWGLISRPSVYLLLRWVYVNPATRTVVDKP